MNYGTDSIYSKTVSQERALFKFNFKLLHLFSQTLLVQNLSPYFDHSRWVMTNHYKVIGQSQVTFLAESGKKKRILLHFFNTWMLLSFLNFCSKIGCKLTRNHGCYSFSAEEIQTRQTLLVWEPTKSHFKASFRLYFKLHFVMARTLNKIFTLFLHF